MRKEEAMGVRLERVVAAVDFGEASVTAAQWAARYFTRDTEFVLAHVLHAREAPGWLRTRPASKRQIMALAREAAERRLQALVPELGARLVFTEVIVGSPPETISDLASEFHAELIVVGPHGPRPVPWNLLGSTAERLVRVSRKPVLVVRSPRPRTPRKVLVPLDDVHVPAAARKWIMRLHSECDAAATALTVLPFASGEPRLESPLVPGWPEPPPPMDVGRQADRWVEGVRRELALDANGLSSRVAYGNPAQEIVAAAREIGSDLVLMASRGPSALGRAVLGSVAASVMRGAPCPVLVVRDAPAGSRSKRKGTR